MKKLTIILYLLGLWVAFLLGAAYSKSHDPIEFKVCETAYIKLMEDNNKTRLFNYIFYRIMDFKQKGYNVEKLETIYEERKENGKRSN